MLDMLGIFWAEGVLYAICGNGKDTKTKTKTKTNTKTKTKTITLNCMIVQVAEVEGVLYAMGGNDGSSSLNSVEVLKHNVTLSQLHNLIFHKIFLI